MEILTGISKGGGVGIGEGANAESRAVIIGNSGPVTDNSNGGDRVWIGYTATADPNVNMKSVVIGTVRGGQFDDRYGPDRTTVSNSVLIGGKMSRRDPSFSINGSTIINSYINGSF